MEAGHKVGQFAKDRRASKVLDDVRGISKTEMGAEIEFA